MTARPLVLAHRGGALEAPENSMEAFERAIRLGYPGVELDVRASKDGVPVVIHDARFKPAPRKAWRSVRDTLAADMAMLPTLDSVLGLPWGRMTLMVEVKHDRAVRRDREIAAVVARALRASKLPNAFLASFSANLLEAAGKAEPSVRRVAIVDEETYFKEKGLDRLRVHAWAVDLGFLEVDEAAAGEMRGRGRLWGWTIKNLRELKSALALGVDGIITDIPGKVLQRLGRMPRPAP